MKSWFFCFVLFALLLVSTVPVEAARNLDDGLPPRDSSFCWLWQSGFQSGSGNLARTPLMTPGLVSAPSLRTGGLSSSLMRALHSTPGLSREAIAYQLPLWRVEPLPAFPLAGDASICAPDPIVDVRLAPARIIQGQTVVLHLTTRVPSACEVTYIGHTVPCYHIDDENHYALLGISALTPPGTYPLHVSLKFEGRTLDFTMDVEFVTGHYGYQFINPPTALHGLLNQELMENEWAYLRPWRELRTRDRMWNYPLRSPLETIPSISADYGDRRSYGGMFEGYHSGIDYRAATGTPVVAPAAGRVVFVDRLEARGNTILVDHGWGLVTGYWHLSAIDVAVGDRVTEGERLGWVGNTGLSTGSHLHWEVWVNGVAVDGRQWLGGDDPLVHLPLPTTLGSRNGVFEPKPPEPH